MFRDNQTIYSFHGPLGVRVDIGASFLLLAFVVIGFSFNNLQDLIWSLSVFAMLAGSIYLHELGHAWGSLVQGVPARRIVLHGGGGFCERKASASPYQDELIVAMGPIVNLTIWAIASLGADLLWKIAPDAYWTIALLDRLAWLNLFLALFNLLPVQPLDGGKLFHLGLLRVFDQRISMRVAGLVGLVLSVVWIPAMILMYLGVGWVLFFIPSIALHWSYVQLRQFSQLKRHN